MDNNFHDNFVEPLFEINSFNNCHLFFLMKVGTFCSCFQGLFMAVELKSRKHLPKKCHCMFIYEDYLLHVIV